MIAENYEAFSWDSINADLRKIQEEMTEKAVKDGLAPEEAKTCVAAAFAIAARSFMEVNGFVEPNRQEKK